MDPTHREGFATVVSDKGRRRSMEDSYIVIPSTTFGIAGVFDGHGGDAVSTYCSENIVRHILTQYRNNTDRNMKAVLTDAIFGLDDELSRTINSAECGSTVCLAIVLPDDIWIANVGDSRIAVRLNSNRFVFTEDHKPHIETERRRIVSIGGVIMPDNAGHMRINGVLNVSRSVGDHGLRPFVIPTPDVYHVPRKDAIYAIIASDGLWDVFTTAEVMSTIDDFIALRMPFKDIILNIAHQAASRGSTDNITILLVNFRSSTSLSP